MFKNGVNNAIKISSSGFANSNVNSSTYILLDSGSNPTPGKNIGAIKFNIATQLEGALDRFVITPTTSTFYNNVGIGKIPNSYDYGPQPNNALDVSGNLGVSGNIYTESIKPMLDYFPKDMNITTRLEGNLNLSSEAGNIYLKTNNINRFKVDASGYVYSYDNFDVSGNLNGKVISENNISLINKYATIANLNLKQDILTFSNPLIKDESNNITIDLSSYALNNSLNASNVTSGTLPVSFGGTGSTALTADQILIGNGTGPFITSNNLKWDTSNNKLSTVNIDAFGVVAAYGGLFTQNNLSVSDSAFITNDLHVYKNAFISRDLSVVGKITVYSDLFSANSSSKSLIQFQTKLGANGLYYYNIDLDKYYKTGQTINGNEYKIFNITSWAEDAFSIINKCTVYISSQSPGIKYIMFYDNWGAYLSNGNQSGWQRDTSIRYMTFVTATQKNIITILENLL
jgi:hypothetical protein